MQGLSSVSFSSLKVKLGEFSTTLTEMSVKGREYYNS